MRFFRLYLKTESHCLKGKLQESSKLLLLSEEKYITEEKLLTRWLSLTEQFVLIVFLLFFFYIVKADQTIVSLWQRQLFIPVLIPAFCSVCLSFFFSFFPPPLSPFCKPIISIFSHKRRETVDIQKIFPLFPCYKKSYLPLHQPMPVSRCKWHSDHVVK